jgi:deoxyribodipyrimidine photo-lyase
MNRYQVPVSIWWARRDLRLTDNQALATALSCSQRIIPVFVLDPALLAPGGSEKRVAFLFGGLAALDAELRARGSRLIIRRGDPSTELTSLVTETGATAIWAEEDPWPYARRRDAAVAAQLPLHMTGGITVHQPDAVRKASGLASVSGHGSPYTVFTPYARAWRALHFPDRASLLVAPVHLAPPPEDLSGLPLPTSPALPAGVPFRPGETVAQRRLAAFTRPRPAEDRVWVKGASTTAPIDNYADARNRMALDATSQLSPYLRFGMISPRQAAVAAHEAAMSAPDAAARAGAETWLNELIWREFYMAILYHFPDVLQQAFRGEFRTIPWLNDSADFAAWCEGRTGYPVVDAAMRQLVRTGWMHNRARMIAASFLVKDLLVDWQWGEQFFMQHLIDGDPASNNGGWQWTAGVGTDAAPYFRVFNPILQGMKFDPTGDYARRWVTELAGVPDEYVHEPWSMPAAIQEQANCVIGRDYPIPIVDHAWARQRALVAYRQQREKPHADGSQPGAWGDRRS